MVWMSFVIKLFWYGCSVPIVHVHIKSLSFPTVETCKFTKDVNLEDYRQISRLNTFLTLISSTGKYGLLYQWCHTLKGGLDHIREQANMNSLLGRHNLINFNVPCKIQLVSSQLIIHVLSTTIATQTVKYPYINWQNNVKKHGNRVSEENCMHFFNVFCKELDFIASFTIETNGQKHTVLQLP